MKRVRLALLYHKNRERRATVTSKTHFMPVFSRDNTSYKGPRQIMARIKGDFTRALHLRLREERIELLARTK